MSIATSHVAMTAFFEANKPSGTAVVWGSDDPSPKGNNPWVRFNVLHSNGTQASMGAPTANRFRQTGQVIAQVFARKGDFGKAARELASAIHDVYCGAVSGGVTYSNPRVNEVGVDQQGWYQINVVADFRYDIVT